MLNIYNELAYKGLGHAIMGYPALVGQFKGFNFKGFYFILWGKIFLHQLKGMVSACAPASIFMERTLVPCFVVIWSMVKNTVWPSVALSVSRLPSLGRAEVILSECRGYVETITML